METSENRNKLGRPNWLRWAALCARIYFCLEDQIPENHLLRLIDKHISFEFVRQQLKDSYSDTGRPSTDPELLLRILLIGHLYGITSERKLVEELRMHLAWRWFTGLGFDQEIPHHSTFSKNRHGRFQESKLFEQLFEQIVRQCVEVGLVQGEHLSVDGSFVEAESVAADTAYGNGEFLQWLSDRSITPYMRTRDRIHRKNSPFFGPDRFTYEPENNRYICPAGQPLSRRSIRAGSEWNNRRIT
jgi:transposase